MNLFEKVFRELNKTRVKYLVVGGVAVNLYGYLRFTGDLDLLLLLNNFMRGRTAGAPISTRAFSCASVS